MNKVDELLAFLTTCGLSITHGKDRGTLLLCGPKEAKTPGVIAAVQTFKAELLERFPYVEAKPEECRDCNRELTQEDRDVLRRSMGILCGDGACAWKERL